MLVDPAGHRLPPPAQPRRKRPDRRRPRPGRARRQRDRRRPDLPGGDKLSSAARRRPRGEPARHGGPGRSAGQRLRRQADRTQPAAGRQRRRQRQLDELARPGEGGARRQGPSPISPSAPRTARFTVAGPMNPGLLMAAGHSQELLSPQVQVNLTTKLDHRRADTRLSLTLAGDGGRRRRNGRSRPKPVPGFQGRRPPVPAEGDRAQSRTAPTSASRWS